VRLPIRVRLTAWYSLLLAAIIVALGAFLVLRLRADLQATIDREVRASSGQIAQGYSAEGPKDFLDVSRTVLPRTGAAAQVLDSNGHVLIRYGDRVAAQPMASQQARAQALVGNEPVRTVPLGPNRQDYRAMVAFAPRHGKRRFLVVAESLHSVEESVHRVLILLLLAGPAALGATALGGWWLARKALHPVDVITSEAEEIGIDRLHERIAVPQAGDEISHLAVTLNAMLDRLEQGVDEKRRLIADASHELRTPLAAMRSRSASCAR
jgi:signal transduction histidine kinase